MATWVRRDERRKTLRNVFRTMPNCLNLTSPAHANLWSRIRTTQPKTFLPPTAGLVFRSKKN